ncbi:MAG: GGDEF domain-containing protein, partial [Candidatus Omnitrophica bacterium]|nr:GGDEF domain-containing protein [Candidatus Omnitrophota bacterium]
MTKAAFFILVVLFVVICIAGFSILLVQQDNILRRYFILNPLEDLKKFNTSLSSSLSKYFARENASSSLDGVVDYIKKYGSTSLFDLIFIYRDVDGSIRQASKMGITPVSKEALKTDTIYPVSIDNGKLEGYLMIVIKEAVDPAFREGLAKYRLITYSVRFLYTLLIIMIAVVLLYHAYSAKMRLAKDIAEIKASNDGLTGLHTHEHFMKALEIEVEKFRIYNMPVALLMLDVDRFKEFNDKFGHQAGDKVLEEVSKIIRTNTRATDILGRYGGEEFAVIIPYVARAGEIQDSRKKLKGFIEEIKQVTERT